MTTLLGFSGSLRRASLNTALLRTAQDLVPPEVEIVIHDLADLPFYSGDVEDAGLPAPVAALRRAAARADGLLLACPEYNWSVTAVMKNAIDWLSRGPDSPLDHAVVALVSAAGGSGGARAQEHLRQILRHNDCDVLPESLQVPRARHHVIDGELVTPEHRDRLGIVVAALADRAAASPAASAA